VIALGAENAQRGQHQRRAVCGNGLFICEHRVLIFANNHLTLVIAGAKQE
jgi:hypothetical protein